MCPPAEYASPLVKLTAGETRLRPRGLCQVHRQSGRCSQVAYRGRAKRLRRAREDTPRELEEDG